MLFTLIHTKTTHLISSLGWSWAKGNQEHSDFKDNPLFIYFFSFTLMNHHPKLCYKKEAAFDPSSRVVVEQTQSQASRKVLILWLSQNGWALNHHHAKASICIDSYNMIFCCWSVSWFKLHIITSTICWHTLFLLWSLLNFQGMEVLVNQRVRETSSQSLVLMAEEWEASFLVKS